jgi:hypothetical protein
MHSKHYSWGFLCSCTTAKNAILPSRPPSAEFSQKAISVTRHTVDVIIGDDQRIRIDVRWHLCADLKLVCLVGGLGGASSRWPCPRCLWNRSEATKPGEPRSVEGISNQPAWSTELLEPIRKEEATLKEAKEAMSAARKQLAEVNNTGYGKSKQV